MLDPVQFNLCILKVPISLIVYVGVFVFGACCNWKVRRVGIYIYEV